MHIFWEVPFIKPQKDTSTTDKRPKTMKNERKGLVLFGFSFYSLFGAWKIVGIFFVVVLFLLCFLCFCIERHLLLFLIKKIHDVRITNDKNAASLARADGSLCRGGCRPGQGVQDPNPP